MKNYKVTMFLAIENKPHFYSIEVRCKDVSMEVWLNPMYKNICDVEEI